MKTAYPAKVLIAWGEAISGNSKIREWLLKNGYPELGIFVYALNAKTDAQAWLMKNGHPHLMALVEASEGNEQAMDWLEKQKLDVLAHLARVGKGEDESYRWLIENGFSDFAVIGMKIREVVERVEADRTDVHKFYY